MNIESRRTPRCSQTVYWWDSDATYRCHRPDGHAGYHRDGVCWFDGDGMRQPQPVEPEMPIGHLFPHRDPSISCYNRGCRCEGCRADRSRDYYAKKAAS